MNQLSETVMAELRGSSQYPSIRGTVVFRSVPGGTEVIADIDGLPDYRGPMRGRRSIGPFGFHLHAMGNCDMGEMSDPFMQAGGHWNPDNRPHGDHAGDFPVLFSNHGKAKMRFFTDRFTPAEVVGKSVMIHENPDDYTSQPAGNSGRRIACGVIRRISGPYQKKY